MGPPTAVRAARYVPRWVHRGRHREGPDEDTLTLALAAVDRLESEGGPVRPHRVRFFGPLLPNGVEVLAAALGIGANQVAVQPDSESELGKAIGAAGSEDGTLTLWLFAEANRDAGPLHTTLRDAGAVAILGTLTPEATGSEGLPSGTALGAPGTALARADRLVGDAPLRPEGSGPEPSGSEPPPAIGSLDARSEGAYVPRARYLENLPSRLRFAAERCRACGELTFPVRGYCRACGREDELEPVELARRGGIVEASTTIHPGAQPTEFDGWVAARGAYDVALVRLAPGALVTLQGSDAPPGAIVPGARVDTAVRRLYPMEGEWRYGRKAVPAGPLGGEGP
jgi:uncharacterized OB-fold protein